MPKFSRGAPAPRTPSRRLGALAFGHHDIVSGAVAAASRAHNLADAAPGDPDDDTVLFEQRQDRGDGRAAVDGRHDSTDTLFVKRQMEIRLCVVFSHL